MNPSVVSKTTLFAIKKEINEFEENQNPSEGVPVMEEFVALTGVNTGSNSVMQESAGAAAKTNEVVPASPGPGEGAKNNETTDVNFADGVNGLGRKSPTASTVVGSKPWSNLLGADRDRAPKGCSTVTSVREVGEKGKNCPQPNGVQSSSVVNTEKNSGGSEDSSKKPMICRVCKEKFIEAGLLDTHYKDVHKMSDPYQCWRCDYLTSAYRCMERHMEFCGSDTPFPCIECNRTFRNAAGVTLHMVRAHSKVSADKNPDPKTGTNSTFACMECGDMFGTVELLAVHYIRSHAKDFVVMSNEATNELRCSKCSAFFDNKDLLLKHKIETHSKDLRVVVPKLKVVYADSRRKKMKKTDEGDEGSDAAAGATKSEAAAKKTRLRPRKVRPIVKEGDEIEAENGTGDEDWEFKKDETGYLCPYFDKGCLYKNAKKRNLQRHLQSKHSDESSAVYTCPFKESGCTYEAHHRDLVRKHAKTHNKNYTCDSCDFACAKKKELKCHRLDVHGISWRPRHLCPICGREFKNNPKLQIHLRVHRNDRPFICDQCAKCFTCTAMLKTHQNVKHGNKKYACPTCGKEFPIKQYLNKHLRTHNNDKPFLCEICSKGFKTGSHLKAHVRMHTGEKPYECKECGKRFKQICGLHAHQKVHTGEKPYVCTECSRAFTYYSSLKGGLCSQCQREDRKAPKAAENVKEETVEVDV